MQDLRFFDKWRGDLNAIAGRCAVSHLGPCWLSPSSVRAGCPPPRSSPASGGGRCCYMLVLKLHVAASPSPTCGGRPGWGAASTIQLQRANCYPSARFVPEWRPGLLRTRLPATASGGGRCCHMLVLKLHVAASPSPTCGGRPGWGAASTIQLQRAHFNDSEQTVTLQPGLYLNGDQAYSSACQPPPRAAISATLLTHWVLCNDSKLCCALRLLFSVVATSR